MSKGSGRRPQEIDEKTMSANWAATFGAKAAASSTIEADRNGGQGKAQDGRSAEGDDEQG